MSFLVGDVGGTNCRFALAERSPQGLALRHPQHFKCADFAAAEDAIDAYLRALPETTPRLGAVVLAVAGPVIDGDVKSTNMDWRMSERTLRHYAASVKLINDFAALSLSVSRLHATDPRRIGPDVEGAASETIALLGAGTGPGRRRAGPWHRRSRRHGD